MPTLMDQAREEAYASAPATAAIFPVIRMDEPSFSEPLYLIAGKEEDTVITLEDGTTVKAIACAYTVTLHGFDDKGPNTAKAEISNVSGQIYVQLRKAKNAISVEYRAYLGEDLSAPVDIITGYLLRKVQVSAIKCEGELSFAEIATQAFPLRTYDIDTYPGLWNS